MRTNTAAAFDPQLKVPFHGGFKIDGHTQVHTYKLLAFTRIFVRRTPTLRDILAHPPS